MKFPLLLVSLFVGGLQTFAQNPVFAGREMPAIMISDHVSLHFLSPEPISYVDISTSDVAGDLPLENVLRLRIKNDSSGSAVKSLRDCTVTIAGESFIVQYRLISSLGDHIPALVNIVPEDMKPLAVPGVTLTRPQMKRHALAMLQYHDSHSVRKASFAGMKMMLNRLYTVDDLIFMDLTFCNGTNLPFDIDELRFSIEDKKITKATNVQSVEIKPIWKLYADTRFKREFRNIYVLKKVTFPQDKILNIDLSEKQLSGRSLSLQILYKDVLNADTF